MQTRIIARHFEASDGLRSYVAHALDRLERYDDRIHGAHVILHDAAGVEKRAEIALAAPQHTFTSACAAPSHEAAVDGCVRRLRRQMTRASPRRRRRRRLGEARA